MKVIKFYVALYDVIFSCNGSVDVHFLQRPTLTLILSKQYTISTFTNCHLARQCLFLHICGSICPYRCYFTCYFILGIVLYRFYCTFVLLSQRWLNRDVQTLILELRLWDLEACVAYSPARSYARHVGGMSGIKGHYPLTFLRCWSITKIHRKLLLHNHAPTVSIPHNFV